MPDRIPPYGCASTPCVGSSCDCCENARKNRSPNSDEPPMALSYSNLYAVNGLYKRSGCGTRSEAACWPGYNGITDWQKMFCAGEFAGVSGVPTGGIAGHVPCSGY